MPQKVTTNQGCDGKKFWWPGQEKYVAQHISQIISVKEMLRKSSTHIPVVDPGFS